MSISDHEQSPQKIVAAAKNFPFDRFVIQNEFLESKSSQTIWDSSKTSYFFFFFFIKGATVVFKKWIRGKGQIFVAIF